MLLASADRQLEAAPIEHLKAEKGSTIAIL
jgi:hypothetical protein